MAEQKLEISGMTCGHCVMHVKNAFLALEGVEGAEVSLEEKTAVVNFDDSKIGAADLPGALSGTNYTASPI